MSEQISIAVVSRTNALEAILETLDVGITFTRRSVPLPPDLRSLWRIPLVLLLLRECCIKSQSSIRRLHVLSWASRTRKAQRVLIAAINGNKRPEDVVLRIEPTLNQAIAFALAEGLLAQDGRRVTLTVPGGNLVDAVKADPALYAEEKAFARTIGKRVTEDWVTRLSTIAVPRDIR